MEPKKSGNDNVHQLDGAQKLEALKERVQAWSEWARGYRFDLIGFTTAVFVFVGIIRSQLGWAGETAALVVGVLHFALWGHMVGWSREVAGMAAFVALSYMIADRFVAMGTLMAQSNFEICINVGAAIALAAFALRTISQTPSAQS
ncbi:MAG: hypothetical protein AAB605_01455 [Patescibacteria group bacterium]